MSANLTFVDTNRFAIGEKAEACWGIMIYKLAREAGMKYFVRTTNDYSSKLGGFKPEFRCGHAGGDGEVSEFIGVQPTSPMAWSILHSGPCMETLSEMLVPFPDNPGPSIMVFAR